MNGRVFQELKTKTSPYEQVVAPVNIPQELSSRGIPLASLKVNVKNDALVAFVYVGDEKLKFFNLLRTQNGHVNVSISAQDARAFSPAATWDQLKTGKLERPQWLLLDLSKTTDWRKSKYEIIPPSSIKVE